MSRLVAVLTCAIWACGGPRGPQEASGDGGRPDGGVALQEPTADASRPDTGPVGIILRGRPDASADQLDAGADQVDAGQLDAGQLDAGALACEPGFLDCDGLSSNGCEWDGCAMVVFLNLRACGMCGDVELCGCGPLVSKRELCALDCNGMGDGVP